MNLNALSVHMMLSLSSSWLEDEDFCQTLKQVGPLGEGVVDEIALAHDPLAKLESNRNAAQAALKALIDQATKLDFLHDRKARALYFHLRALAEGSDDTKLAEKYRELQQLLFPHGLRVIQLPYLEEKGAAVALEQAITPEVRAGLAKIVVGEQTLDDLLTAWLKAAYALGHAVKQRAELKASLARGGSAVGDIDLNAGRKAWIQAVRGLLWAIDSKAKLRVLDEQVSAAIEEAMSISVRRREGGEVEVAAVEGAEEGEGQEVDEANEANEADEVQEDALEDEDPMSAEDSFA